MRQKKIDRKERADERKASYDKLTPIEKIARLDVKLGANVGAVKQRARLEIEKNKPSKPVKKEKKTQEEKVEKKKKYKSKYDQKKRSRNE